MKIKEGSKLFGITQSTTTEDGYPKIIPYIEKYLTLVPNVGDYTVEDRFKPIDRVNLHPSNECLACKRRLYFEKSGKYDKQFIENKSTELQITFKIGHALHAMIQAWFADMTRLDGFPSLIENECKVHDDKLRIAGSIDSLMTFPGIDHEVPIEIKTKTANLFKGLAVPDLAHKLQVSTYLMLKDLPYGIILYISKDRPHKMKEFIITQMDMGPILDRWEKVKTALDDGDVKALDYECALGDSTYKKCPCRGVCRSEGINVSGGMQIWHR